MHDPVHSHFEQHRLLTQKAEAELAPAIARVGKLLCDSLEQGGKILTFGNGGSAADALHMAEEFTGRFQRTRRALAAVCLNADGPALTCIANDFGYAEVFARQVQALARPGDVVIGFSTSGNSENVLRGLQAAKNQSAVTVALLGNGGGKIAPVVDHPLIVPTTARPHFVQEIHIILVHLLCDIVDAWAAGE